MRNRTLAVSTTIILVFAALHFDASQVARSQTENTRPDKSKNEKSPPAKERKGTEQATFGSGCFWCTEAIFQQVKGVQSVVSGYTGGQVKNPTYRQVCDGTTGHAEVLQVTFDPKVVSFSDLLEIFWKTHDPTTLNRQGNDEGTQYRSAIFYHSDEQRKLAEHFKAKLNVSSAFRAPIVTEITKVSEFYPAEAYHQNYFKNNPDQAYCRAIIAPKLEKFKKVFNDQLK